MKGTSRRVSELRIPAVLAAVMVPAGNVEQYSQLLAAS